MTGQSRPGSVVSASSILRRTCQAAVITLAGLLLVGACLVLASAPALAEPTPAPNTTPGVPDPVPSPASPSGTSPELRGGGFSLTSPLSGWALDAITDWIAGLAAPMIGPVLNTFGAAVLTTPDIAGNQRVAELWSTTRLIANTLFVLLIVAGGVVVAAKDSLQVRTGIREVLPRIVVAAVAVNTSLPIVDKTIEFANAITTAIAGQGVNTQVAQAAIKQMLDNEVGGLGFLVGLLRLAVVVMALAVILTFAARVMITVILVISAPLALTCHALPHTEGIAFGWWRALAGVLAVQLGQAIVLLAFLRLYVTPWGQNLLGVPTNSTAWVNLLVLLCLLWLMLAIPMWVRKLVFRGRGPGVISRLVRTVFIAKTLGRTVGLGRSGRGHRPTPVSGASPSRVTVQRQTTATDRTTRGPARQPGRVSVAGSRMGPRDATGWRYITPNGHPSPPPARPIAGNSRAVTQGPSRRGLTAGTTPPRHSGGGDA